MPTSGQALGQSSLFHSFLLAGPSRAYAWSNSPGRLVDRPCQRKSFHHLVVDWPCQNSSLNHLVDRWPCQEESLLDHSSAWNVSPPILLVLALVLNTNRMKMTDRMTMTERVTMTDRVTTADRVKMMDRVTRMVTNWVVLRGVSSIVILISDYASVLLPEWQTHPAELYAHVHGDI
jgi:hypothetical protein